MHDTTQEEIPMTKEEFQKLTQNVVLLDGATGSNLMAAGMPRGICTEAWIMDHKEILQNLHLLKVHIRQLLVILAGKLLHQPSLSHLSGALYDKRFTIVFILPFQKFIDS